MYSSDLYIDVYGNCKYFNQKPWDVAMSRNIVEEFNDLERLFSQKVRNGKFDLNEYLVLLKITLDRPLINFERR